MNTLMIIIGVICLIVLAYISSNKKWNNDTRPPKGWTQHKGFRTRMNK